ncbi:hypothetical protein [Lacimicrobium sp. SS2-24]|uniref:hypothetical protein n=1 Tax=Lacimicrobium sp. SS2-24 TaxID=2005569 RepID=UPI000B4B3790|nr:hypothetical protein [Lacimicrobium sp. SS2-24]
MKHALIALCLTLSVVACKTTHTIYNADTTLSTVNIKDKTLKRAIIEALLYKRWHVISEEENKIIAGINVRQHYAEIEIPYQNGSFEINYRDSKKLDYDAAKNGIHRNYNKWIQLLESEIQRNAYLLDN